MSSRWALHGGVKSQGRFCMHRRAFTVSRRSQKSFCVGWIGASMGVKWQWYTCFIKSSMVSIMMRSSWVMGVGVSSWGG
jgi:hypothetical protein